MNKISQKLEYKRRWAASTRFLKKCKRDSNFCCDEYNIDNQSSIPHASLKHLSISGNMNVRELIKHSPTIENDEQQDECFLYNNWKGNDEPTDLSSDTETELHDDSFKEGLAEWAVECNVPHSTVDRLLHFLKKSGHPDLPGSARTLLSSCSYVEIGMKSGMEYYYFGLIDEVLKHFKLYSLSKRNEINNLEISLNIDGLPLFRSSGISFWPVLCAIVNLKPIIVFPVTLTCGKSKPSDLEFLSEIISDLKILLQQGLLCDDKYISVSIRCIVCDAPARAMVRSIKLCTGYSGCDKCDQHGKYFGRVTYQDIENLNLRTDDQFRRQIDKSHHHCGQSPFCELPIDMVKSFPVDYMHQVCLGVMKRLLLLWIRGPRNVKLSALQVQQISSRLEGMKHNFPFTFSRKPHGLIEIDRWKATEYRQFLLYTGKLVLYKILRPDLYSHFMTFSVALAILVSPILSAVYRSHAHQLLLNFVAQGRNLYGEEFLIYNVHSLLHLADEVKEYGSLDKCSAFPFENYMYQLKRLVRSGNKPLQQVVKRIMEKSEKTKLAEEIEAKVSVNAPNNAYVLENSTCCEVVSAEKDHSFLC